MRELDCRGLPCPQPVIETKNALDALKVGERLCVLVDNEAAVKNVSRFAEAQGHGVEVAEDEAGFRLVIEKGAKAPSPSGSCVLTEAPAVLVLSSRGMGSGDGDLARLLLRAFLKTLAELDQGPESVVCYNEGVLLAVEGSEVLEELRALEQKGARIMVCGTCLDYYRVKDRLAVGEISNMYDIATTLLSGRPLRP